MDDFHPLRQQGIPNEKLEVSQEQEHMYRTIYPRTAIGNISVFDKWLLPGCLIPIHLCSIAVLSLGRQGVGYKMATTVSVSVGQSSFPLLPILTN